MKFYIALFLLCFGALGFSAFGQVSTVKKNINGKEYYVHTIQKGQTVYSLTKLYGVTEKDIYAANPGAESGITAGKDLLIPILKPGTTTTPTGTTPTTTTTSTPPTTNPPVKPPVQTHPNAIKYLTHTVSKSETLYGLSKHYGVTVESIIAANPDVVNGLKAGMVIRIPQGSDAPLVEVETKNEPKEEKEETEEVKTPVSTVVAVPDLGNKFKTKKDCVNNALKKKEYTVALLVPFGNNPRPDNKQARVAFQFYAGVQLAQQMYLPKEISIDWEVYNTGESDDSVTIARLISTGALDNADIILGPLYTSGLYQVAAYAASRKIPVLSPTSRLSAILDGNPYVIKTTPSPESFLVGLAEYMVQRFDHIILVEPSGVEDSLTMRALEKEVNALINVGSRNSIKSVSYIEAGKASPMDLVKPGVRNLIYYPTKKELTVTNFLTGLRKLKSSDKVSIMGDESWLRFRNFDPDYYSNVGLMVPILHFSAPQVASFEPFVKKFRDEYKTDPEIYAFRGYDAACYITDMLENYGNSLPECIRFDSPKYLFSPFKMLKKQGGGFDNKGVTVLVIEDYQLRIESN